MWICTHRQIMITLTPGVFPATTTKQLIASTKAPKALFDCCVDLGRMAENTPGNARETATWVNEHQFKSLILVTADFHFKRTMIEFGRALPGVRLVPYPAQHLAERWWRDPHAAQVVLYEYFKYLLTRARWFG